MESFLLNIIDCVKAREVFDSMVADSKVELKEMRVDGGATANKFLMQFQSDILNVPVVRPEIEKMWAVNTKWNPSMNDGERQKLWKGWNKAVQRSMHWLEDDEV